MVLANDGSGHMKLLHFGLNLLTVQHSVGCAALAIEFFGNGHEVAVNLKSFFVQDCETPQSKLQLKRGTIVIISAASLLSPKLLSTHTGRSRDCTGGTTARVE